MVELNLDKQVNLSISQDNYLSYWSHLACYSDQVWRRYHRHSTTDRLIRDTRKRGIFGAKDWSYTIQRHTYFCPKHCLISCENNFQSASIEVPNFKQQGSIMVTYYIPWWRTTHLKGWWRRCVCSYQGRQFSFDKPKKLKKLYWFTFLVIM